MSLPFWNCEPGSTESPKGKLCKGSSNPELSHAKEHWSARIKQSSQDWTQTGGYRAVGTPGKAVGRGRNHLGWLRIGRDARGGYGTDGWGGNRPKHYFYGDFRGTKTVTLFPHGFWTGRRENTERDRVRSILMGKKETVGRRADRSLSWRPHVCLERTEGNEPREKDRRIRTWILGQTTVQASLVDTGPPCSDANGSDPYTNGSRLGCLEMVPERKHRKRPSEINPDGKERENWPEGRSEFQLETACLSVHNDSV
ncbi:hypothetical protein YC2023_072165 [Brassica napus]